MVQKPFEELTIADDTAKQCTSCTLLSYEFSYRKLVTTWYPCHPWQIMEHDKKIILDATAFKETDNKELQGFLQYVKTGKIGQPHQKYLRWLHSFCAKF